MPNSGLGSVVPVITTRNTVATDQNASGDRAARSFDTVRAAPRRSRSTSLSAGPAARW
jgi:hypothetical protein